MKVRSSLALIGVSMLLLVGCVAMPAVPGATVEDGMVIFKGEGMSVVAKEGDPLSLVEAKTAAAVMAKADLLETIKGAFVSNRSEVRDLMFESQQAMVVVEGFLARSVVTYEEQARGVEPMVVKAKATLTLSCAQIAMLEKYAE